MTEAPDYVEPVMGVRRWNVKEGMLFSTGVTDRRWQPEQHARATCVLPWQRFAGVDAAAAHELEVPMEGCTCGYHAWVNLETCNQRFPVQLPTLVPAGNYQSVNHHADMVTGVVSSWGKIILCECGFRAEYMKIEALILPEKTDIEVLGHAVSIKQAYEALAERYNVELVPEQVVDEFMGERGVVLEADPVPVDDVVMAANLKAAAALGWKLGPPPIPSGTPYPPWRPQQGMRVTYMPISEKPSVRSRRWDEEFVADFGWFLIFLMLISSAFAALDVGGPQALWGAVQSTSILGIGVAIVKGWPVGRCE